MRYVMIGFTCVLVGCGLLPGGEDPAEPTLSEPSVETVSTEPVLVPDSDAQTTGAANATVPDASLPPPVGVGSSLGRTVVSLGDPSQGGMWLKTPLVKTERPGQVRYRGTIVAVTLQPLDAEIGAGSQISVRAMQALGASLTDLVEVDVEAI